MNRPIVIKLNPIQSVYKQRGLELSLLAFTASHMAEEQKVQSIQKLHRPNAKRYP